MKTNERIVRLICNQIDGREEVEILYYAVDVGVQEVENWLPFPDQRGHFRIEGYHAVLDVLLLRFSKDC